MSRTVELGRAVLSSSNANLELWLTTLISVSQQQSTINIQQLSVNELINLLSSGNVWVGRGTGMHLIFNITLQQEPLASDRLRQLAEGIVEAPAWRQLGLQPSLPVNFTIEKGKLHINISQCRGDSHLREQKSHRICTNVPSADIKPPQGIPVLQLQSVQLTLMITTNKSRVTVASRKRAKRKIGRLPTPAGDIAALASQGEEGSEILYDEELIDDEGSKILESILPSQMRPDHARTRGSHFESGEAYPMAVIPSLTSPINNAKRKHNSSISISTVVPAETTIRSDLEHIANMIDASMRLSALNTLKGAPDGFRIKANSFTRCLGDVVPALWRPGYLVAMSQRAHLAPTLSLSLSRSSLRAQSAPLQAKIVALTTPLLHDHQSQHHPATLGHAVNSVTSSIADYIWTHTQKRLLAKPSSGLIQSFCISGRRIASVPDFSEILEECTEQPNREQETFDALDDFRSVDGHHAIDTFHDGLPANASDQDETLMSEWFP